MISGFMLRFAHKDLRRSFIARFGLMVLAICLGGAIMDALLTATTGLFDKEGVMSERPAQLVATVAFATIPGAIVGALEGILLAPPLAALLGLFRRER